MSDVGSDAQELYQDVKKKLAEDEGKSDREEDESPKRHRSSHHKDKKRHKRRHLNEKEEEAEEEEQEEEEEEEGGYEGIRDLLEQQASEDEDQQSQIGSSEEFEREERDNDLENQLYKQPRLTDQFIKRLDGKNEQQVNRMFRHKMNKLRENEEMLPSAQDHKMFIVMVKPNKQEKLVGRILNKAYFYSKSNNNAYRMSITTAFSFKKKYPGKIFIEAATEKDVRDSLDGFVDVNLGQIRMMDEESYSSLFDLKEEAIISFRKDNFVRIRKGVYADDLGRICKIKKHSVDVLLVPRLNLQEVLTRMKEETSKLSEEKQINSRKAAILKQYANPRVTYPNNARPLKKQFNDALLHELSSVPGFKKYLSTKDGLLIVSFRVDEIMKPQGPYLPVQLRPFSKTGNIVQEFQDDKQRNNLATEVSFAKGDEAEIQVGELQGCYGTVMEIKDKTVFIKCLSKILKHKIIEEHIDNLSKRFKEGQRVRVAFGENKGKTGVILSVDGPYAQIWTDNENSIKISKNNLELYSGQAISQDNVMGLKKDDLIKTTKNGVGIVVSTNKNSIKILDTSNTLQIISNLDYQSKIAANSVTKSRNGDLIKSKAIVRLQRGVLEGKRCEVKHVYHDYVFVFNPELDKTGGVAVEKAENCTVIAKASEFVGRGKFPSKNESKKPFGSNQLDKEPKHPQLAGDDYQSSWMSKPDDDLKVGKSITISSGPLKGYRGVIKSLNKDKIEVRVMQKNCTEWIPRDKINQQSDSNQIGRTPRRAISMTAMYASQSPSNY